MYFPFLYIAFLCLPSSTNPTFSKSPPWGACPAPSAGGFRGGLLIVQLKVFDLLIDKPQSPGNYKVQFILPDFRA